MQNKGVFAIIFLVLNLGFVLGFFAFGVFNLSLILSFEMASFCSLFYVLISFLSYQRLIKNAVKNANLRAKPLFIFMKKQANLSSKLIFKDYNEKQDLKSKLKNFSAFFSLLKLLVLSIFILSFLALNHSNLLSILGVFSGVSCLVLCVLAFAFFNARLKSLNSNLGFKNSNLKAQNPCNCKENLNLQSINLKPKRQLNES